MKYLLICLVLLSVKVYGQNLYPKRQQPLPERDTVTSYFLVSDSTLSGIVIPYQIKGYSVRVKSNWNDENGAGSNCWNCPDYMKPIMYLDNNKRPLDNKYIIWQTR